jgi:hypothetical protein
MDNSEEYIRLAVNVLFKKDELQMNEFVRGVYHVLSKQAMHLCSWKFAVDRACGKQTIDMELLRKHSSFASVSELHLNALVSQDQEDWRRNLRERVLACA